MNIYTLVLDTVNNEPSVFTYSDGMKAISDAKIMQGDEFNLRHFHDYLMENGNVPITLLRWEYLGLRDEIGQFFERARSYRSESPRLPMWRSR